MKRLVFFLFFMLMFKISIGQVIPNDSLLQNIKTIEITDSLKQQLNSLQDSVNKYKKVAEEIVTDKKKKQSEINKTKSQIIDKQIEAIRICAKYTDRFSQGTLAMDVILSAIQSNVSLGQLSSPFISPTFKDSYDNWFGKWGKFLPAIIIPALSLFSDNENFKTASVSVGLSITTIASALTKNGDKGRNKDITTAFNNVTSTIDLFDFNRTVYDDIEKLKAIIKSVENSDSTFSSDFSNYIKSNGDLLTLPDDSIKNDPRFKKYIENSTVYFDRFQLKLARVNYVLDFAYGMIQSYEKRYSYITAINLSSNPIYPETQKAIITLKNQYSNLKGKWDTLQSKYYKLTPTETRKLDSFYQLEEILRNLK